MLTAMELRQLRHFVAVAEAGSISRAAKAVFLTQPALSRQIRALEDELGLCLLERGAHSVRLTAAGAAMLPEARALLRQADDLLQRVISAGRNVHLRVGYAPSLASGLLAAAVASFTQAHRGARVELADLSTAEMLEGLANRTLDVVVTVAGTSDPHDLQWTPLVRSPWQLAVNANHHLTNNSHLTPADAASQPLLVFRRGDYPEYWDVLSGWLRKHHLKPAIAGEYDGVESLMAAVEAGLGVALVTSRTAKLFPDRVRLIDLSPAPPPLCIAAGHRADRSSDKPLAVFVAELRKAAQE